MNKAQLQFFSQTLGFLSRNELEYVLKQALCKDHPDFADDWYRVVNTKNRSDRYMFIRRHVSHVNLDIGEIRTSGIPLQNHPALDQLLDRFPTSKITVIGPDGMSHPMDGILQDKNVWDTFRYKHVGSYT
jgi:hypothetical protein